MPPPPELIDDVAAEIFLRLPPDEPEHLVRASLVCKPWLRLLSDPAFLRRYSAFHGAPPLLGLLHLLQVVQGDPEPRLAPTTALPLSPSPYFRRALDCRHGRVLLHGVGGGGWNFIVWDPITGGQQRVPAANIDWLIYSAAVICPVSGCDHLDCHGGPFLVVFVATDDREEIIKASVYFSETGVWSAPVTLDNASPMSIDDRLRALALGGFLWAPYVHPRRGTLIGDEIYFTIRDGNTIIKYDWGKHCLSTVNPPSPSDDSNRISLMVMEDNSLGFAIIQDSMLYTWFRKVDPNGAAEWVQFKVIELKTIIPGDEAIVVGFAEGLGLVFVSTDDGLFTINLESRQVRKVDEPGTYFSVLPYMSFYTPGHTSMSSLVRLTEL